jgi:hypothetical protein
MRNFIQFDGGSLKVSSNESHLLGLLYALYFCV